MHVRIRSLVGTILAVTIFLCLSVAAAAGDSERAATDTPLVVKIHADWCGTCTRMNPTFEKLDAQLEGKARIVILDVTDQEAVARSTAEADRLGVRAFFDRYKSKTGTVGVLNGSTGEPVTVLKGETDTAPYVAAVAVASAG